MGAMGWDYLGIVGNIQQDLRQHLPHATVAVRYILHQTIAEFHHGNVAGLFESMLPFA
jgi:hypothetical protein